MKLSYLVLFRLPLICNLNWLHSITFLSSFFILDPLERHGFALDPLERHWFALDPLERHCLHPSLLLILDLDLDLCVGGRPPLHNIVDFIQTLEKCQIRQRKRKMSIKQKFGLFIKKICMLNKNFDFGAEFLKIW